MEHRDVEISGGGEQGTYFAPTRRASQEALNAQVEAVIRHPVIEALLDSFCGQVLVLNRQRQILAASPEFKEALAACGMQDFVGLRPGEALGCEHAQETPGGCGTSLACAHCGAVMAILAAQCCKSPDYEECWIGIRRRNQRHSIEFRAKATPLKLEGMDLVVLAMQDISDQKRRKVLEQSLLHDARNLLGGILTWSEVMRLETSEEAITSIHTLALQLRELFAGHQMLLQAEKGDLSVNLAPLDLPSMGRLLSDTFSRHPCGEGKNLVVRFPQDAEPPVSDQALVLRILTNMVTNALEATAAGGTVMAWFERRAGTACFLVHNPGVIPEDAVPRIFQRSFSTKVEPGHGIGTYSMRLLAEQYLGGRVAFDTANESGTTFQLTLPDG